MLSDPGLLMLDQRPYLALFRNEPVNHSLTLDSGVAFGARPCLNHIDAPLKFEQLDLVVCQEDFGERFKEGPVFDQATDVQRLVDPRLALVGQLLDQLRSLALTDAEAVGEDSEKVHSVPEADLERAYIIDPI